MNSSESSSGDSEDKLKRCTICTRFAPRLPRFAPFGVCCQCCQLEYIPYYNGPVLFERADVTTFTHFTQIKLDSFHDEFAKLLEPWFTVTYYSGWSGFILIPRNVNAFTFSSPNKAVNLYYGNGNTIRDLIDFDTLFDKYKRNLRVWFGDGISYDWIDKYETHTNLVFSKSKTSDSEKFEKNVTFHDKVRTAIESWEGYGLIWHNRSWHKHEQYSTRSTYSYTTYHNTTYHTNDYHTNQRCNCLTISKRLAVKGSTFTPDSRICLVMHYYCTDNWSPVDAALRLAKKYLNIWKIYTMERVYHPNNFLVSEKGKNAKSRFEKIGENN